MLVYFNFHGRVLLIAQANRTYYSKVENEAGITAMELKELSTNWKKLQETLKKKEPNATRPADPAQNGLKRKRPVKTHEPPPRKARRMDTEKTEPAASLPNTKKHTYAPDAVNSGLAASAPIGKYIAIDCEMVGVGPNPTKESALARVSAVNYNGDQLYDSYVLPKEEVTDWRTQVSGILPKHMVYARSLEEVQAQITEILHERVLVGHAIRNDLDALMLSHPKRDIRDTARHAPYRTLAGGGSPRLKVLASELLGLEIQTGEHSSIEDARACMLLFRRDKDAFEREHAKKWPRSTAPSEEAGEAVKSGKGKKKKKKR